MAANALIKLFEHNHWANLQLIDVCLNLTDEQLDAEPASTVFGTIRATLIHLVEAQDGYLRLLTLPLEQRQASKKVDFSELRVSAIASGDAFIALVSDQSRLEALEMVETSDGYREAPWVILVQAINHATEHREQIKMLLTSLGVEPPDIDGWSYGDVTGASIAPQ